MTLVLQIVACLALVLLMVYLVPLLVQLKRTATALERLSAQLEKDSAQVVAEVQAVRARAEEVAEVAKRSLDQSTPLSQMLTGALRALPAFMGRPASGSGTMETLLSGLFSVINLFRRARTARTKEEHP